MYVKFLKYFYTIVSEIIASKIPNLDLSYLVLSSCFTIYFLTAHNRIGNALYFAMMNGMSNKDNPEQSYSSLSEAMRV